MTSHLVSEPTIAKLERAVGHRLCRCRCKTNGHKGVCTTFPDDDGVCRSCRHQLGGES